MVDAHHSDEEGKDLNFIDEPSQLDKYKAAAQIADGAMKQAMSLC